MTGSLINNIYSAMKQPAPQVGLGATVLGWTDRRAGTIIDVGLDGSFVVQEDRATRTDTNGMSDCQTYAYERDPTGRLWRFRRVARGHQKGLIRENGRKDGSAVVIGVRDKHHDFSF